MSTPEAIAPWSEDHNYRIVGARQVKLRDWLSLQEPDDPATAWLEANDPAKRPRCVTCSVLISSPSQRTYCSIDCRKQANKENRRPSDPSVHRQRRRRMLASMDVHGLAQYRRKAVVRTRTWRANNPSRYQAQSQKRVARDRLRKFGCSEYSCVSCGKHWSPLMNARRRRFCSDRCFRRHRREYQRAHDRSRPRPGRAAARRAARAQRSIAQARPCETCRSMFVPHRKARAHQRYCAANCKRAARVASR